MFNAILILIKFSIDYIHTITSIFNFVGSNSRLYIFLLLIYDYDSSVIIQILYSPSNIIIKASDKLTFKSMNDYDRQLQSKFIRDGQQNMYNTRFTTPRAEHQTC